MAGGEWKALNRIITVPFGSLTSPETIDVNAEQPLVGNVQGSLVKGSATLANVDLNVHSVVDNKATDPTNDPANTSYAMQQWYSNRTNNQGGFAFDLPDGNYQIDGVWVNDDQMWYQLAKQFTVAGGILTAIDQQPVSGDSLLIDLLAPVPVQGNVQAVIKADANTPADNANVQIRTQDMMYLYSAQTNTAGRFGIDLPIGDYELVQVNSVNLGNIPIGQKFSVVSSNDTLLTDLPAEIMLPSVSLVCKLVAGERVLNNVSINLHQAQADVSGDQWFYTTTDEQGIFKLRLPEGNYKIDGVWIPNPVETWNGEWRVLNRIITVPFGNLTSPETIDVYADQPLAGNIKGVLMKGTEPMPNTNITAHTAIDPMDMTSATAAGGNTYMQIFTTATNSEGAFAFDLPDGDYQIDGVSDNNQWYQLDKKFSVTAGALTTVDGVTVTSDQLIVDVLATTPAADANVFGSVKNSAGNPVPQAHIQVQSMLAGSTQQYFWTRTDAAGNFSFALADGEYKLVDVGIGTVYTQDTLFSVTNGVASQRLDIIIDTTITPPADANVFGTVKNTAGICIPLANIQVKLADVSSTQQPYMTQTNANGDFSFKLPDGSYTLVDVGMGPGRVYTKNIPFSVAGGIASPATLEIIIDVTNPPVTQDTLTFVTGYPQLVPTTDNKMMLKLKATMAATAYYAVMLADATPSVADVLTSPTTILVGTQESSFELTGLETGISYRVYLVLQDGAGNQSGVLTTNSAQLGQQTGTGPTGTFSFSAANATDGSRFFSITVQNLPAADAYYNVCYDGTAPAGGNGPVALDTSISIPAEKQDITKMKVKFMTDEMGTNIVAQATLNGSLEAGGNLVFGTNTDPGTGTSSGDTLMFLMQPRVESATSGASLTLKLTLNQDATVYYVIGASTDEVPTPEYLSGGDCTSVGVTMGNELQEPLNLAGFDPSQSTLFLIAVSDTKQTGVISVPLSGQAPAAGSFGFISSPAIMATAMPPQLTFQANMGGTVFYLIKDMNAGQPADSEFTATQSIIFTNTPVTQSIMLSGVSNPTAGTQYKVWLKVQPDSGVVQYFNASFTIPTMGGGYPPNTPPI